MKSVQTKILSLVLMCVLLSGIALGSAGFFNARNVVEEDSSKIMNLQCTQKAQEIDERIRNIMQSVNTVYQYAYQRLDLEKLKSDKKYQETLMKKIQDMMLIALKNTEGAISGYIRTNPELTSSVSGVFLLRNNETKTFENCEMTDISLYSPDDVEHVGWYYLPIWSKKAIWIEPYHNKNIDVKMISYVIPIFKDGVTVGVLGMDIDMELLREIVDSIKLYDQGYAFLTSQDGDVIYHKDYPEGVPVEEFDEDLYSIKNILIGEKKEGKLYEYEWHGQKRKMTLKKLQNKLSLFVTVPSREIDEPQNRLLRQVLVSSVIILVVSVLLSIWVSKMVVRPLKELTEAAKRISRGDLGVNIKCRAKDEIGVLAESLQKTTNHLKKYIHYINRLAYTDAMTGVQNKTAYTDKIKQLETEIEHKTAKFSLCVMDINNLKKMNDTYGHEYGDLLIIDAADVMRRCFGELAVYRIGGDEFVAVLMEKEEQTAFDKRKDVFQAAVAHFNGENERYQEELVIASGYARYQPDTDSSFKDVFRRADKNMYENKIELKKRRKEENHGTD